MSLKHEFGIIDNLNEFSFNEYSPEKFNCISVNDDAIQTLLRPLNMLDTFYHSLDNPNYGLDYYGYTVIPPKSLPKFLDIILTSKLLKKNDDITELCSKIIKAEQENKYMIHYGI